MAIVKNLMELPSFFEIDFEGSYEVLYVTNIFDLPTFDNETTTFLIFFLISTEMHFVFLFFLNK